MGGLKKRKSAKRLLDRLSDWSKLEHLKGFKKPGSNKRS